MLELSQKQETAGMPVIVMTGLAATRLLFEKIKQVKHFITKPFEAEKMLQVVKELIG
jgi:FixJ family two-component response regulator